MENYMKKLIIIFITSLISVSHANSLKDWTNEDLCRWLDSTSIPQQILNEIDARNAICYVSYETNGLSAQIPYEDKEITALPLPKLVLFEPLSPTQLSLLDSASILNLLFEEVLFSPSFISLLIKCNL